MNNSEYQDKETTMDKSIIYIDSDDTTGNAVFNNVSVYDFYVDILEPIRSVMYIKIIRCAIILNPNAKLNGNDISDEDPIYIRVNDYNRCISVIKGNVVKCFEIVNITKTKTYTIMNNTGLSPIITDVAHYTEYPQSAFDVNDTSVYVMNPVEPNLKRFNIQLYDKNNNILTKDNVKLLKLTLCVYSKSRKYS